MNKPSPDDKVREFHFTKKDFDFLRELVLQYSGIALSDNKYELVYGRLARRIRKLDLNNFAEYCKYLTRPDSTELPEFLNAITTNLTAFFREKHHFEFLANHVFPQDWTIKILATDLDSDVLSTAKAGVYKSKSLESVPPDKLKRWFYRGKGKNAELVRVSPELQEIVAFQQLNLMEKWPIKTKFDLMFCRNVIIYFNKDTQRKLIDRYADQLVDNAYFFIGHSESLFRVSERFEKVEKVNTTYRKIS